MRAADSPSRAIPAPLAVMLHTPTQASRRQIERARTSTTMPGTPAGRLVHGVIYISKRERERERSGGQTSHSWLRVLDFLLCKKIPVFRQYTCASRFALRHGAHAHRRPARGRIPAKYSPTSAISQHVEGIFRVACRSVASAHVKILLPHERSPPSSCAVGQRGGSPSSLERIRIEIVSNSNADAALILRKKRGFSVCSVAGSRSRDYQSDPHFQCGLL